jgi:pimeloyl-ACP methyl ester carboxylesterase
VIDGAFGTLTTMVPYMRQWVLIYTPRKFIVKMLPKWYLRYIARRALKKIQRERGVRYPSLGRALAVLAPRPVFMIHGGADNYIKPDMARSLFDMASEPKELWIAEGAKHNQAFHVAGDEYKRRIREFFDRHLATAAVPPSPLPAAESISTNGKPRLPQSEPSQRQAPASTP